MQYERSTQTECNSHPPNTVPSHETSVSEILCSVNTEKPFLPTICVKLNKENFPFLIDSGSSISIMNQHLFQIIKPHIKYTNLSRKVQISTLNSKVEFSACILLSFKIENLFFKHPVYISDFASQSFEGILGNDFLVKNACQINFSSNCIKIKDQSIPFYDNTKPVTPSNVANVVDIDNLMSSPQSHKVTLRNKLVIQPFEQVYAMVSSSMFNEKNFLFNPTCDTFDITPYASLHSSSERNLDENVSNASSNLNKFYIVVQNNTNEVVHLNKSMHIGQAIPITADDIQPNCSKQNSPEAINLLIPSKEILNQRKLDLSTKDFDLQHLSSSEQKQLENLLLENFAAFSKQLSTLGHTDKIVPEFSFTSEYPIKCLPFPVPYALQQTAKDQLNELQSAGLIERAVTSWSCPMLLVKKKLAPNDPVQKFRLALDLRLVNTILKPSAYPLPRISTIISNLSSFKFFSSLDLSNAYWQIDLPTKYQDILAFATPWGTFRNKRLVFGLKNSASTFQALMDSILDEVGLPGIFAYQDDIVIASNSFEETYSKVAKILNILTKYNITLSPSKCSFHKTSINYLGFQVSQNKIFPIQANICKITSFPQPKSKKQLKTFIGICGYYRTLIPAYAELIQPLNNLTSNSAPFIWEEIHHQAFQKLQAIFFKKPFTQQPDWSKKFILNTDASINGISGILMQENENILLPIAYFSKATSPAQQKYPALKLELLALYSSIKAFHFYLYNRPFIILSDSKPLAHYKSISSPATIITRWLMAISEYSFEFKHIPGQNNILADFLSRFEETPPHEDLNSNPSLISSDQVLPVINSHHLVNNVTTSASPESQDAPLEISTATLIKEQAEDSQLSDIINLIKQQQHYDKYKNYFIHPESKLLCYDKNPNDPQVCNPIIVIPKSLISKVLKIAHYGHTGIKKTYEFLKEKYFWSGCYADTCNYVTSCTTCIQNKPHNIPHAPLQPTPLPSAPSQKVSMDILGPFDNHKYILTTIDIFSRHLYLTPLNTITTQAITEALFQYISIFGRPACILTDQGTQFISEAIAILNKTLGIKLIHTSAAHPQANAISERINTAIKATVKSLISQGHSFKTAILIHQNLYNGSKHSTTGFSPNLIHFGRPLSLFYDTFQLHHEITNLDKSAYITKLLQTLKSLYSIVLKNNSEKQVIQNQTKNLNAKLRKFEAQDIVYLKSRDKFRPQYKGPYQILRVHPPVNYTIQWLENPTAKAFKVHVDRLLLAPRRKQHLNSNSQIHTSDVNHSNTFSSIHRSPYILRSRVPA
jgi:hypothetical protein